MGRELCRFVHAGYVWFAIPWALLFWLRQRSQPGISLTNMGYPLTTWKHILITSVWMSWLLVLVAYAWYLSLPLTQVGANTTVYQSASVFVFIFSIFLLNEAATMRKVLSVAISVLGVALIASTSGSSDSSEQGDSVLGYVFLIVSVLLYALYEVLYKYCIEEADAAPHKRGEAQPGFEASAGRIDEQTTFEQPLLVEEREANRSVQAGVDGSGRKPTNTEQLLLELELPMLLSALVGLVSIVTQWPVFFILSALPENSVLYEANTFTFDHESWELLAANSFLDSWYYMLLVFGIALTGPVFMSVGVMLVSPVSIVVDWYLHGTQLSVGSWIGVGAVIAGFATLQVETRFAFLENRIHFYWNGNMPCLSLVPISQKS